MPEKTASQRNEEPYKPKIVVFACNWCSYAGADMAGVSRLQYPPDIRIIRTMCSGRVNPGWILKAFELGADGVLWSGCHFGDCHYIFGNYKAVENYEKVKEITRMLGIQDKRLRLEWVSAAEGMRWAELIKEFTDDIKSLGPSPHGARNEHGVDSAGFESLERAALP